jgi:hypothetical protein
MNMPAGTEDTVKVTVEQGGDVLATMTFDDRNMTFAIGDVQIVCRNAVVESIVAPIWQRVAHAAMVAAYTGQGLDDVE